jgi:hypothetical protein
MTNGFMGGILGAIGAMFYFAAPFQKEEKRALAARLIAEGLMALMFLYLYAWAGISYCVALAVSAVFEKKIEKNAKFSLAYGIIGAAVTCIVNNAGLSGYVLGLSLILVFLHLDDEKFMMTSSYIDVLNPLMLAWYSLRVKAWVGLVFALLLMAIAIAGMYSSLRLSRAGGMDAARAEEIQYQKKQAEKKKQNQNAKKAKKARKK